MTAVVTNPRPALWDEAQDALNRHRAAATRDEAAYWIGVNVGILAAVLPTAAPLYTDQYKAARDKLFARAYPVDELGYLRMLPADDRSQLMIESIYRASGVLFGWKQATAELPDADECMACEQRVLAADCERAVHCRYHGTFCDEDCARTVCEPLCERQDWQ